MILASAATALVISLSPAIGDWQLIGWDTHSTNQNVVSVSHCLTGTYGWKPDNKGVIQAPAHTLIRCANASGVTVQRR